MIGDILKPKSDRQIILEIAKNPCPVERFVLGFSFYYEKWKDPTQISELIEALRDPTLKITINVNREEIGPFIGAFIGGIKGYGDVEYEIIVETGVMEDFSLVNYNRSIIEYKRKTIIVQGDRCYIM